MPFGIEKSNYDVVVNVTCLRIDIDFLIKVPDAVAQEFSALKSTPGYKVDQENLFAYTVDTALDLEETAWAIVRSLEGTYGLKALLKFNGVKIDRG